MEKHKEAEALVPAEKAQVPAEKAQVPAKEAQMPAKEAQIPAKEAQVSAEKAQVPAEEPLGGKVLTMPEADRVEFKSKTDPYGSPMGGDNSGF